MLLPCLANCVFRKLEYPQLLYECSFQAVPTSRPTMRPRMRHNWFGRTQFASRVSERMQRLTPPSADPKLERLCFIAFVIIVVLVAFL